MKPTFDIGKGTYFGGKNAAGVVHTIINQIPKHDFFVSGFLGRCAVMRWKKPAHVQIGIDLDPEVLSIWHYSNSVSGNHICLYQEDFLKYQPQTCYHPNTFLYLDPPYLPETRSSNNKYHCELTTAQHLELLTVAKSLPCMVAISCYDSDMYIEQLDNWRKIHFQSQTRGGQRTETLYMNYPEPSPDQLHDTRFLGINFRDRERGKRRIETIKRKIGRLEPNEKARLSGWLRDLVASNNSAMEASEPAVPA
jgi:hypothetical protein